MSTIEKAAERMAALKNKRLAATAAAQPETTEPANAEPSLNRSIFRQEDGATPPAAATAAVERATTGNFSPASLRTFNFPAVPDEVWELDLQGLEEVGYLAASDGSSPQATEFRRIKRPILLRMQKDNAVAQRDVSDGEFVRSRNRVMITSALPEEGKTFISLNLAMSLAAEMDGSVTLIDSDIAKGDLTRLLNMRDRTGLGDVLLDSAMASRALVSTSVNRMSVMPAGTYSEHLGELYASDMTDRLIQALDARLPNQVLLFDAPPLLVTTEATVLARYMDQIILVIEANRTPREAVQRAIEELDGLNNVSLLLNKTTQSTLLNYGYRYGYGAHAGDMDDLDDLSGAA